MEMFKMTADDICAIDPELAIIPVGSLEQHGPHLPIMTDWIIASELGRRVAERMNALFSSSYGVANFFAPNEYVKLSRLISLKKRFCSAERFERFVFAKVSS